MGVAYSRDRGLFIFFGSRGGGLFDGGGLFEWRLIRGFTVIHKWYRLCGTITKIKKKLRTI
tara:strand:- start:149 stop:331 length:183 start_codon:yes stop_codon:yes gene_type:complete